MMLTRSQQLGLLIILFVFIVYVSLARPVTVHRGWPCDPLVVAVLGSTATGKSALALALAERFDGEIINCDSTAVYRGFDIGTDKVGVADRRGIPHHLIDVADPTEEYTAARYARDAASAIRDIHARGRLPILAGGTGLLLSRVDARPVSRSRPRCGPAAAARRTSPRSAACRSSTGCCARVDPPSADRIQPRDLKRIVRALEVFFLTGRPLTSHFAETASPIPDIDVMGIAVRLPAAAISDRVDAAGRRTVRPRAAR